MTAEGLIEGSAAAGVASDRPQTPEFSPLPQSETPPTITHRHSLGNVEIGSSSRRAVSEAMEADVLSRRLKELENTGRQRERTPGRSPSRKRQRVFGDR